jgi:hypothetical protein
MAPIKGIRARKRSSVKGRPSAARTAGNGSTSAKLPGAAGGSKAGGRSGSTFGRAQSGPELFEILGKQIRDSAGRGWAAATGRKGPTATGRKPAAQAGRKPAAPAGRKPAAGTGGKRAAATGGKRASARSGTGGSGLRRITGPGGLLNSARRRGSRAAGETRAQLYEIARRRDLPGRSTMRKDELARKLGMR